MGPCFLESLTLWLPIATSSKISLLLLASLSLSRASLLALTSMLRLVRMRILCDLALAAATEGLNRRRDWCFHCLDVTTPMEEKGHQK
ncbi:hypothetical protein V6N13_095004 [Hibiscus sabdariffa]|uniref:Secreted protein n=1 Tax=Hibiscus sabdariffa TaxID=183260 RepID=A0ABR2PTJ9_9ROSI